MVDKILTVNIFVISLKRSKDRRILIKKELDHLDMPFSFLMQLMASF